MTLTAPIWISAKSPIAPESALAQAVVSSASARMATINLVTNQWYGVSASLLLAIGACSAGSPPATSEPTHSEVPTHGGAHVKEYTWGHSEDAADSAAT